MKKIITASLVAMMAVTTAHADIASTTYVDSRTGDVDSSAFIGALEAGKQNLTGAVDALAKKLTDGNLTIATGAVDTEQLADDAVTADKLAPDSVLSDNIKNGEVKTVDIADDAVTSAKIADGAVTSAKIADGAIADADIADNADIAQKKIAGLGDALNGKVDKNQGTENVGKGLVVDAQGALGLVDVATQTELDDAVLGLEGQIEGISGGVATELSQFKTLIDADIAAKVSIDQTDKNANKAVITNGDGQITTGQIATGMIADDAVTADKLATDSVLSDNIKDGEVKTVDIADGNVTSAKLDSDVQASLALADSAMQESALKALDSWSGQKCGTTGVTCSLVSKDGNIAWEAVKY